MDKAYIQANYISGNLNSQRMNTHTHAHTHARVRAHTHTGRMVELTEKSDKRNLNKFMNYK